MTDDKTALRELLMIGTDASTLREMIAFAAERLMELEVGGRTNAALWNASNVQRARKWAFDDSTLETHPKALGIAFNRA